MSKLRTDSIRKLKGLAPFEQIMSFYDDPADFNADLNSYLIGRPNNGIKICFTIY